jgi:hypothetical protein
LAKQQVDHRGLVDDHDVGVDRILFPPFEGHLRWIELQQPMDGLRLLSGHFGHSLSGAARRAAKGNPLSHGEEEAQPWPGVVVVFRSPDHRSG